MSQSGGATALFILRLRSTWISLITFKRSITKFLVLKFSKMLFYTGLILAILGSVYSSDVIELEDSSFSAEVSRHDIVLVEFFAPWCGHCKRLAPEYETAATALKKADPPVALAKVDCTEKGKESCGKYGVSGYPTIKIFRNGEFSKEYDGPRDSNGIVAYMSKQAGPSSKELVTMADMQKVMEMENAITIGFFAGGDDDLKKAFMTTANELRDKYSFAHTTNEEIMEKFQHKDEVVIFRPRRLHTKLESPKEVYSGSADDFYIKKFLKAKLHGLVGHLTPDNEDQFKMPLCTVFYNVDYKRNAKGTNYWRNRVLKAANNFKDTKAMTYAIANSNDFSRQLDTFGLSPKDEPVATIKNEVGDKFVMTAKKFSVDTFKQFLQDYFDGKLSPYVKSEEVPETNDGPVKVVTGKTFKEIVNDPTKDVLIEFYAPWCGHCKSLEPKFNELGEKLQHVEDIVIAKIDATANDVPSPYKVEGFPTIYWSPMNSKDNPEKYQGGREVSDFVDYIKGKSTNPFTLDEEKKSKKSKKDKKEEL